MNITTDKKFNVYIVNYKTNVACSLIWTNMNEKNAEKRIISWLSRCNSDYGVYDVEVGSEDDLKYSNDIKNEK